MTDISNPTPPKPSVSSHTPPTTGSPFSDQALPPGAEPSTKDLITLQLCNNRFITHRTTLTEKSVFFQSLLSANWNTTMRPDGSYFIDSDPEVFAHVLRYLRSGVPPLFHHGSGTGWDYGLYALVLEQARFFGIEELEKWIGGKKYLAVVKVQRSARMLESYAELDGSSGWETEIEYFPVWETRKVYVCPRGIACHRGEPSKCGKQCKHARGDEGDEYEDENVLKVLEVSKKTIVEQGMMDFGA